MLHNFQEMLPADVHHTASLHLGFPQHAQGWKGAPLAAATLRLSKTLDVPAVQQSLGASPLLSCAGSVPASLAGCMPEASFPAQILDFPGSWTWAEPCFWLPPAAVG